MDPDLIPKLAALIVENARVAGHSAPAEVLQDLGTPTVSFAILDGDTVTAHCLTNGSDDTNTLFQACSISKPTAALAAFKLIEEKKLSLTASISEYLPASDLAALETEGTRGMAKNITISHLLSHTSGLETSGFLGFPGYDTSIDANGQPRAALPSLREVLTGSHPSNTLPIRLKDWPGHRYNYSGGGVTVLQLIMEIVTGLPFEQLMHEYVFRPLRMGSATYQPPSVEDLNDSLHRNKQGVGNYARAHHTGYTPCEDPHRVNPEQAAAGLWITPTDLLKVASAVQQSYKSKSSRFMSASSARDMLREVQDGVAHSWFVGGRYFRHGGSNMPGYRCHLFGSLETDRAIAIMTNSAQGFTTFCRLLDAICYLAEWPVPPEVWCNDVAIIPFANVRAVLPDDNILQDWVGIWVTNDKRQTRVELLLNSGKPHVRMGGASPIPLHVAAHPKGVVPNGTTIVEDLVCKGGLEILVRLLKGEDGQPSLQMWDGNTRDRILMEKMF